MKVVYHYCTVGTFFKMVTSQAIHASNVLYMNDHMEMEWFRTICRNVLETDRNGVVRLHHSAGSENVSAPHSYYHAQLVASLSNLRFDHIYCACFSKKPDDLSQWRGYADDGRGICIGVDLDAITAANPTCPNLRAVDVEYDLEKQEGVARQIIRDGAEVVGASVLDGMQRAGFVYSSLRFHAPEFKNPCFAAEKEVRLVTGVTIDGSSLNKTQYNSKLLHGLPSDVDFRERNGKLIPYVVLSFPLSSIVEVCVGPRFGNNLHADAIRLFMSKNTISAELRCSRASYSG